MFAAAHYHHAQDRQGKMRHDDFSLLLAYLVYLAFLGMKKIIIQYIVPLFDLIDLWVLPSRLSIWLFILIGYPLLILCRPSPLASPPTLSGEFVK